MAKKAPTPREAIAVEESETTKLKKKPYERRSWPGSSSS